MKKQFGLPLMLASALAFSACSSDDVAENGNGSLTDFSNGGYVKLAINLPTVKAAGAFKLQTITMTILIMDWQMSMM